MGKVDCLPVEHRVKFKILTYNQALSDQSKAYMLDKPKVYPSQKPEVSELFCAISFSYMSDPDLW